MPIIADKPIPPVPPRQRRSGQRRWTRHGSIAFMTSDRALTLVRQDMAAGRHNAAIRRLRAMLASDPGDIVAYRLLTEIHRAIGNPAEAGRWGFLSGDATLEEIEAFERAHPQPWVRIRLLGKTIDPARLPNETARTRLAELHQQVTEATIPLQSRRTPHQTASSSPGSTPRHPGNRIPTQRAGLESPSGSTEANRPIGGRFDAVLRRLFWSRRARFDRPRPLRPHSLAVSTRNYLLLGLMIVGGVAGSLAAVAGVRAIFGITNWFAPVEAILEAIGRLFQA